MDSRVLIGIGGCAVLFVLVIVVRLYFSVRDLQSSIAKLGYVIREDAKLYFDEAAAKITETNESFRQSSVEVIAEANKKALVQSSAIVEQTLARAHQESGSIILEARENARRIIDASQTEANKNYIRAIEQSSSTIEWVLSKYAGRTISTQQHEEIIRKLFNDYINENRQ